MDTGSPRKIQFTVPLLDTHLDPEAAEQIRRRRPTPATLVVSSDQSSPEIDEDRLPNQLYKAALLNSPRQRRKGPKGTPTMKELQYLVEHHLYRQQQQQQQGGDECSSESCLSDRPSPESTPAAEELPCDGDFSAELSAEAFEKLRCQMEEFSRDSLLEDGGGLQCPLLMEKMGCSIVPGLADPSPASQDNTQADTKPAPPAEAAAAPAAPAPPAAAAPAPPPAEAAAPAAAAPALVVAPPPAAAAASAEAAGAAGAAGKGKSDGGTEKVK